MASSSTTTRTPRIALRVQLIPYGRFLMRACRRRFDGMKSLIATLRTSLCSPCRNALRRSVILMKKWMTTPGSLEKLLDLLAETKRRDSAMHRGRRIFARWKAKLRASLHHELAKSNTQRNHDVKMPLLVIANSPDKEAALAGWSAGKRNIADAAELLAIDDVLVDSMRGRSSTWTRIRVNLRHVPGGVATTTGDAGPG